MRTILLFMILGLCVSCTEKKPVVEQQETKQAKQDMKQSIEKYLAENPEVLMDIIWDNRVELIGIVEQGAQQREAFDPSLRREMELADPREPAVDPARILKGDPAAPVLIVEYSNFQCSFCARGFSTIKTLLEKNPGVKVLFKHLPFDELSELSARYFEAAALQDPEKAWKLHDKLFLEQQNVMDQKEQAVYDMAAGLELDMERLQQDAYSDIVSNHLEADLRESVRFGFRGTPSFLVGGVSIIGAQPIEVFEDILRRIEERDAKAQ